MKKIAFLLLLIFTAVQAVPAITSLVSPSTMVFMMDEEQSEDKHKEDQKKDCKKIFLRQSLQAASAQSQRAFTDHRSESLLPSPFLEKVSPPPNFY